MIFLMNFSRRSDTASGLLLVLGQSQIALTTMSRVQLSRKSDDANTSEFS